MKSTQKFTQALQLFKFTDLPFNAQQAQLRLIEAFNASMNEERAYDAILADSIDRIVFVYRYHHPRFRMPLQTFVDNGKQ